MNLQRMTLSSKLSFLGMAVLVLTLGVTVTLGYRTYILRSQAWMTSQSAVSACVSGKAVIKATFTNTEPANTNLGMNVTVKDAQTGQSVVMGKVDVQQTKTVTITSSGDKLAYGKVTYLLTWSNGLSGTDQRTASYNPLTCVPPTPTITPTPTVIPDESLSPTPTPVGENEPTSTPGPLSGKTTIKLTLFLHGLGNGGDNANPKSKGNMELKRTERMFDIEIYDSANALVYSGPFTVKFDGASGNFKGSVDLGESFVSGIFRAKVKGSQFLKTFIPGILTITKGTVTELPPVYIVSGDINDDNAVNILDFNLMIGCYSDLLPALNCKDLLSSDLNDDGVVNQYDYNLFLREMTNRGGQ